MTPRLAIASRLEVGGACYDVIESISRQPSEELYNLLIHGSWYSTSAL